MTIDYLPSYDPAWGDPRLGRWCEWPRMPDTGYSPLSVDISASRGDPVTPRERWIHDWHIKQETHR